MLRFLAHFNSALIYFLFAAAAAAAVLGHVVDGGVILAVVLVNAIVGFVQEGKAESALEAIRAMIAPRATALRDGTRVSVAVDALVPGDVVTPEAGDRVPADQNYAKGVHADQVSAVFAQFRQARRIDRLEDQHRPSDVSQETSCLHLLPRRFRRCLQHGRQH